ncbi:hypothetical protein BDR07DRAFT_1424990 [Suillus spraguei]|nr:hypothetical protein BDR07DRAFT_1424990 [Suillus spraguei]
MLLDTPSALEKRIGMVRREITGYYTAFINRWISVEEMVEKPLNPGLLYTGISALTTSVLTRSRSLPTRIFLPPIALASAFAYFLPLEDRYAPRFGEIEETSVATSVNQGVKNVVETMGWAQEVKKEAQSVADVVEKDIKEAIESKSSSGDSGDSKRLV